VLKEGGLGRGATGVPNGTGTHLGYLRRAAKPYDCAFPTLLATGMEWDWKYSPPLASCGVSFYGIVLTARSNWSERVEEALAEPGG